MLDDGLDFRGAKGAQYVEDSFRAERIDDVVGAERRRLSGNGDENDGKVRLKLPDTPDEFGRRQIVDLAVYQGAIDVGKAPERFDCFGGTVCGKDVKFRRLDDELSCRDAACVFRVEDKETRARHRSIIANAIGILQRDPANRNL